MNRRKRRSLRGNKAEVFFALKTASAATAGRDLGKDVSSVWIRTFQVSRTILFALFHEDSQNWPFGS